MSKFKYNYKNMIKEAQKGERSPLIVYGIIRLLIIICMILQLINTCHLLQACQKYNCHHTF